MGESMAGELRFSLLGGLRITLKEGEAEAPLPGLSTQKGQALLCYLALTRRPQSRDTLASLLWIDDPQEEARDSLRHVLLVLRKAASPYLLITRDTVAFNTERPYWLDVDVFRDKFATANRALPADDPASAVALREAMDLYKGELFEGFYLPRAALFEEWVLTERQLLHGMAIEALHRLAGASIRQGNAAEAITYLSRLLVLEPWREEASRDLMRRLAETGQRSAAVAQYEACRRILLAELGVEPGVETVALYGQILAGKITPGVSGIAPPTPKPAPRPPNNLPAALTSLLGRDTELTQLVDRLQRPDVRLLTLVGEGGIGKTRLATELASRLLPAFPDGVFVVSLAALHDAELVPSAIGQVLKIQEGQDQSYLDVLKA